MFVCSGNSCKRQLAKGFARAAEVEPYSARTEHAGYMHPFAVQVIAGEEIYILSYASKGLDQKQHRARMC
jgi:protein-tyrosine-phosphatase